MGLVGYDERLPSELSGGQQQRVALARALVLEPAVLLFDEPLSNLDTKLRRHVREEIRELQQRLQITCVYVTHDREEAMAVSDHIIVMDRGNIAEVGTPHQLFFQPRTAFVADFLSEANVATGRVVAFDNGIATLTLGNSTFDLATDSATIGEAKIALRPDVFEVTTDADASPALDATVLKCAFIGKGVELVVNTAAGEMFVFLPKEKIIRAVGSQVRLAFPPDEARLIV